MRWEREVPSWESSTRCPSLREWPALLWAGSQRLGLVLLVPPAIVSAQRAPFAEVPTLTIRDAMRHGDAHACGNRARVSLCGLLDVLKPAGSPCWQDCSQSLHGRNGPASTVDA